MSATKTEHHPNPSAFKINRRQAQSLPDMPEGISADSFNEAVRQAVAWQLVSLVEDGATLASRICDDPAFSSPDDRVTAALTAARIINANASLGRALATLAQVEQRRRIVVARAESVPVWNDSNSIQEAATMREIQTKIVRYLKFFADDTLDSSLQEAEAAKTGGPSHGPAGA